MAAEDLKFDYPFRRYKSLREEKAESKPLTAEEVHHFVACVDAHWRDYFQLRFWTGMRSCEVHGLCWEHIDFDHRLIRIRQNLVNGVVCDVKTPKSRRDLVMNDTLYELFLRQKNCPYTSDTFVFTNRKGLGLDTHWVSKKDLASNAD